MSCIRSALFLPVLSHRPTQGLVPVSTEDKKKLQFPHLFPSCSSLLCFKKEGRGESVSFSFGPSFCMLLPEAGHERKDAGEED